MRIASQGPMIAALFSGYVGIYIDKMVIGFALLPIGEQFSLSSAQLGYLPGIFFLAYSCFQVPSGWLNDRIGYRRGLMIALGIIAGCAALFGWLASSLLTLLLLRFTAGIGHAGFPSATAKAVVSHFSVEKRTFVQSVLLSSSGLAMALGPLLAVWALQTLGWREAYLVLALLLLGLMLLIAAVVPGGAKTTAQPPTDYRRLLRSPMIWQLFGANFFINIPVYALMVWLPRYLSSVHHLSLTTTGLMISAGGVASWGASLLTGWLVGRYMAGREPLAMLFSCSLGMLAILGLIYAHQTWLLSLAVMLVCGAMVSAFITTFTLPMKRFAPAIIGSVTGLLNASGTLGGFVGPVVMGYLLNYTPGDYRPGFYFLLFALLLAGVVLLPLKRMQGDLSQHQRSTL